MSQNETFTTSPTLLFRVRDLNDRDAWNDFVERYTPKIYGWCKRQGLQDSDASDVTQEVLGKLVKSMKNFHYDPSQGSFRGWLKTITMNAIRDFAKTLMKPGRGSGDTVTHARLAALQAPEVLQELADVIQEEGGREMLREAEGRCKLRVKPHTWEAYHLTVREEKKAVEVADELGIAVADVYVAKSRMIKMVQKELEAIDRQSAHP